MKKWQPISIVLLLASSILSGNLNAEIYTWTDKNGKVHFSDKPIDNENITTIKPKKNNNIASTLAKNDQWQQDYNKAKQAKAEKAKEIAKQTKAKKAYCNQLKSRLAILKQGGRIYVMSPDGERNFQSDAQLKAKIKKLSKVYKKSCS